MPRLQIPVSTTASEILDGLGHVQHYMDLNYRWSYLLADGQRCSILRVLHGRDMHALSGIDRRKYRNEDAQV